MLGLSDGGWLRRRGQLPRGLLGAIGIRRVEGIGWRLLERGGGGGGEGGEDGGRVGVVGSGSGTVKEVSKEGIKVVPGGHGCGAEREG